MSVSLSQINLSPYLVGPAQLASLMLLMLYVVILGLSIYRYWGEFGTRGILPWILTFVGILLAPLFSTSLAIELPWGDLPPPISVPVEPPAPTLLPLAFVPVVLSAGWLGVIPTILIAGAGGFARALWGTNRLFTVFEWMLAASLLAVFIRQNYWGRFSRLLRLPIFAALASAVGVGIAAYITFLVDGSDAGLPGLESITVQWQAYGLPLTLELLLAGVAAEAVRLGLPRLWVRHEIYQPPPYATSLNNRLLYILAPIIFVGIVVLAIANHGIATNVATSIVVDQMERDAQNAADGIPFFVRTGESLIRDLARDESLQTNNIEARNEQLANGIRTVPYFSQLVYFDISGTPSGAYPQLDVTGLGLSRQELEAAELALQGVPRTVTVYPREADDPVQIAYIAPVEDSANDTIVGALVGRANVAANPLMEPVTNSLQGLLVGTGTGFITDENNRIIFHPDNSRLGEEWLPVEAADPLDTTVDAGLAYRDRAPNGAPQLVYYLPAAGHPWQVVIVVPNQAVSQQASQISVPLFAILLFVGALAILVLRIASTYITRPLKRLTEATAAIEQGEMDLPVLVGGDDEVGQLGSAYEKMRIRLRARLEELGLLLGVSQAVASSLDLESSLPPILDAAQFVTDAVGVRLLVGAAPAEGNKITSFHHGEVEAKMAALDSELLGLVEREGPLTIENLARARAVLDVARVLPEIQALIALPLYHETNYLGALWLGFDHTRAFIDNETSFLKTLAGQAAVAIANAKLYEVSEGGRQQLQAILSSTPDAVIVTDWRDRLLLINPAAEAVFELNGAAMENKPFREVLQQPKLVALLQKDVDSSNPQEIELPDGRTLYATASPIERSDGTKLGRVAVLRDVTHFKQLDQLKTEFVATVSHDLRAPLTFIRGYTTMLPMVGKLNIKQQEFAEKILRGVEQMTELIDELLDLNRIEAGVGVVREQFNIATVVEKAITNLQPLYENKDLKMDVQLASDLPAVSGDPTLVRQAISNLVDNAIKYTPSGGEIQVSAKLSKANIVLTVKDSGMGISQPDQVRLFEKFYRVRHKESLTVKGSGLGLSIVRSIAERHNGQVWVESRLGQGSTFFFAIPVRPQMKKQPA